MHVSLPVFSQVLDVPLTVKMRTGVQERVSLAHRLLPELRDWGVSLVTVGVWHWVGNCGSPGLLFSVSLFGPLLSPYVHSYPSPLSPSACRPPSHLITIPHLLAPWPLPGTALHQAS